MKGKKRLVLWCSGALVLLRGRRPLIGFTLVEILIAITLIIVVAVATFTTFRGGTAAWQQGTAHAQRNAGARATLEMMARELSKATLVFADGAYQIDFVGAASRIYFIGSLETPRPGQPDLVKVRYDLSADIDPGPGERRNLRRADVLIDNNITDNFTDDRTHTLASDVMGLTFRFLDNQRHFNSTATYPNWRTTWNSRRAILADPEVTTQDLATVGTLPDAVEITLTSDPEGPGRGLPAKDFSIVTELPRAAPQPFGFSISLNPSSGSVVQGSSVSSTVTVELTGGTPETVNLSVIVPTLPAGVTANWMTTSGSPTFTRTLTLTADSTATLETRTIEIRGTTVGGGLQESAFYTLTVFSPFSYTLSVSPGAVLVGRSNTTITATVTATLDPPTAEPREIAFLPPSGVPAGTTAAISPSLLTPTGTATLTIDITTGTLLGNHPITVTATGGGITPRNATFTLSVFDFNLSVGSISSGQGGSQATTVTATLEWGGATPTPAAITVTTSSSTPAHIRVGEAIAANPHGPITFPVNSVNGATATRNLTVAVDPPAPLGNHTITIAATGGGITRIATPTLSVFDLASLSATNLTLVRGGSGVTTVNAILAAGPPASGTPARVTLSGIAPTGSDITIGTGTIDFPIGSTSGSTTLTVGTTAATPLGIHAITITARCNGNSIVHETTFTLTVPGITVSPTVGLTTTEAGGQATFTVVLATQPTANVTIGLSSSNTAEGTVSPTSLTFTSLNWSTARTVTVTGVNDAIDDGNIAYTIITAPATGGDYGGLDAANVSVTNIDDDTRGITVSPTVGLTTTEAGGQATFTVVLATQPTANVTIGLSSSNTAEGTVSPTSLTFTSANWSTARTVTVTGVNDPIPIDDGNIAYTIITAPATGGDYGGLDAANVSVTNTDNDVEMNFGSAAARGFEDGALQRVTDPTGYPSSTAGDALNEWRVGAEVTLDNFDDTPRRAWTDHPGIFSGLRTHVSSPTALGRWGSTADEQGGALSSEDSRGNAWVERTFDLDTYIPAGATITNATLIFDYTMNSTDFDHDNNFLFFYVYIQDGTGVWRKIDGDSLGLTDTSPTPDGADWIRVWDPSHTPDNPNETHDDYARTNVWDVTSQSLAWLFNNRAGTERQFTLRFRIFVRLFGRWGTLDEYYYFSVDDARIIIEHTL